MKQYRLCRSRIASRSSNSRSRRSSSSLSVRPEEAAARCGRFEGVRAPLLTGVSRVELLQLAGLEAQPAVVAVARRAAAVGGVADAAAARADAVEERVLLAV